MDVGDRTCPDAYTYRELGLYSDGRTASAVLDLTDGAHGKQEIHLI